MPQRHGYFGVMLPIAVILTAAGAGGFEILRQFQALQNSPDRLFQETALPVSADTVSNTLRLIPPPKPIVAHVPLPQEVRGFYWTAETARIGRAQELIAYMQKNGLNTVVIDLKMDNGEVVLPPQELIDELGQKEVYRIARLPVMRDSVYARANPDHAIKSISGKLWTDKTGAHWLDPSKKEVADNAIALAKQAYQMGFDEIQLDYVRYASDGALSAIAKTEAEKSKSKSQVMREFFEYVGGELKKAGIPSSADLFGMTFLTAEDFGIGQKLEDVYPFFDFVSPMAYPSHYWPGFQGFKNPAEHPYEVVKHTLDKGAEILETDLFVSSTLSRPKFRPWIQDFDLGAVYTSARIEAQIKASRDAGASGWLLWNARNVYEPAKYAP